MKEVCEHKKIMIIVDDIDACKKDEIVIVCKCGKKWTKKQWNQYNKNK